MTAAVVAFTVLASLGGLAAVVYVVMENINTQETAGDVCLTQACKSVASSISESIDYSVSPCDDMYQFSCGGWLKKDTRPEDRQHWGQYEIRQERINMVLKGILEAEYNESAPNYEKQVKILYASCMDEEAIKKQGEASLKHFLKNTFNGWPMAESQWNASKFDLVDTMAKIAVYIPYENSGPLMGVFVGIDDRNSSKYVLKMDKTNFGLNARFFSGDRDSKVLKAYETYITGVALLLGGENVTKVQKEVKEMVNFEIKLENISVSDSRDSNVVYNPMTLANISKQYNFGSAGGKGLTFDWNDYITTLLKQHNINITVTSEEIIINQSPPYYENLTQLLQSTEPRTVANYVLYRLLEKLLQTQDEPYLKLRRDLDQVIRGTAEKTARHSKCIRYVTFESLVLITAVNRMFGDSFDSFDAASKRIVVSMLEGVQEAFNESVVEMKWMDKATKDKAMDKNGRVTSLIGNSDRVMNDTYLKQLYLDYNYNKYDFLGNYLYNRIRIFVPTMEALRNPIQPTFGLAYAVSASYAFPSNQITVPEGFLQPPFFSKANPQYLNYGGTGTILGHELTHGFDNTGILFDGEGNLVQWWSNASIAHFKERVQCIIDQYSNFTVPGVDVKIDGVSTQGENIADNGGLKQAFRAYRNWVARKGGEEPRLPGLNFTNDQLFFIQDAQSWCTQTTKDGMLQSVRGGLHAPAMFRVIGPMQNSEDFAKAFNCPKSSFMNPDNKCSVW